jgi:flagella basal body P-ring formation protein FlgA
MSRLSRIALAVLFAALAAVAAPATAGAAPLDTIVAARARAALPADLELVEVVLPESLAAIDTDAGAVSLRWPSSPRAGRFTVPVTVTTAGRERKGWATLVVARKVQVLVASRALKAGATVGAGDVRLEWRAVADDAGWRFAPSGLSGAAVLVAVAAGELLGPTAIAEPAPIARGTEVEVVVSHGRVSVVTTGTLERAVRLGERATVRLASGRRTVDGYLVDANTFVLGVAP